MEFGVYRGGSAWHLAQVAREQGRKLYLFDTFSGMPFQDIEKDRVPVGRFSDTSVEDVQSLIPDAILCPGVFPGSMVDLPPIAFAHVDCDQYQSVRDAWRVFSPLMVQGGAMIFDDVQIVNGARVAFEEVVGQSRRDEIDAGMVRF